MKISYPTGTNDAVTVEYREVIAGVTLDKLERFHELSGLSWKEIHDVVVPATTLHRRRLKCSRLTTAESDRLVRLMRLMNCSVCVFGETEAAQRWLRGRLARFGERTALQLMRTEIGGLTVERMLNAIRMESTRKSLASST